VAEHDGLLPVVAHLLDAEATTRLLRLQDGTASLLRSDGTLVEVVDAASFTTAELVAYLQAAVDGTVRRIVLVVLGGDEQHRDAASNARPVFGSGRIEVCGIDETGTVWWDAQTKAKSPTVRVLGTFDPLRATPVERTQIIARLQPLDASSSHRGRGPRRILRWAALAAICIAVAIVAIPREIRLAPTTTHTFDEVSLIFDAPTDLGAPEVTQEDGGFAYTFSNRDASVFIEVLALPHATAITDAHARRTELVDWVDPDSMDEDIVPVANTTWPTVERAIVRSNDDAITLTWWQVGPLHHVVLTAHHPSRDEADRLREILRTLRAE
jgi:hypothetical protein